MDELSITISILTALLTGGFLMVFIESQKVSGSVTDRFHFVMNPFFRSFSSYVKFISCFKTCFTFKTEKDSEYIKRLKEDVEKIARLGGRSITSGQDFSADHFTAKELDSICRIINNIWYLIDGKQNYIDKHLEFDSHHAQMFSGVTKYYLDAIAPKYKEVQLTKNLLAEVSGDFFVEIYQPIQNILPQYEFWQKKEKEFKILTLATIIFTLVTMILILLFNCYIPMWMYKALCVMCCGLLIFGLYKLIKIENLSKTIMR
ncbi:hypothetical protein MASR1M31_07650 [Porphyromonadaceae bacterium]